MLAQGMLLMNKRNALSLVEVLISIIAISIILLAFAEFSANTFKVNYKHSQILATASETRFLTERIMSQISKSEYIFPANHNLSA